MGTVAGNMKRRLLIVIPLIATSAMSGCLVVTPVVKTGTAVATGAGKVVDATAGKAIGTTINTVRDSGNKDEKREPDSR